MTTAGLDTQPSITAYDLEDLVTLAWRGDIRLPHFQRDFRWGATDVARLFDSIIKGYPIGSLLLWARPSPAARTTLGSLEIEAPASDRVLWVVDGQQRITSLANALHPDGNRHPPFNIAYDLVRKDFALSRGVTDPMVVPLPVLFDLDLLINWFAQGDAAQEGFPEARRVAKLLRQFKVSAYAVRSDDEAALTEIFGWSCSPRSAGTFRVRSRFSPQAATIANRGRCPSGPQSSRVGIGSWQLEPAALGASRLRVWR